MSQPKNKYHGQNAKQKNGTFEMEFDSCNGKKIILSTIVSRLWRYQNIFATDTFFFDMLFGVLVSITAVE